MAENVNDFLEHYGVPGMKWGKRRAKSKTSGQPRRGLSPQTKANIRTAAIGAGLAAVQIGLGIALAKSNIPAGPSRLNRTSVSNGKTMFNEMINKTGGFADFNPQSYAQAGRGKSLFETFDTVSGARPMPSSFSTQQAPRPSRPAPSSASTNRPKAPSPYPMTPLIKTPILDEINRKYGF